MPMLQRPGLQPAPPADESGYPKEMRHPAFQPGVVGEQVQSPNGFTWNPGGKPIRFPPVTVMNSDQEEYYRSRGYVPRR